VICMGKVTGTLYASIYLVLCGMPLAVSLDAETLAWVLWGLAVSILAVLCIFGYRLDALAGESEPMGNIRPRHETKFATQEGHNDVVGRAA
jgi:hypothetical protein